MLSTPKSGYSAVPAGHDTGHYVLALSALSRSGYVPGHLKPVQLTPEVAAAKLGIGDLLISRSNTIELVGLAGIFSEDRTDVSFPDTMMLLKIDGQRVNAQYLEQYLLSRTGRRQLQAIAAGTSASMKKINRKGLASIQIPLPPLDIQRGIVNTLGECTARLAVIRAHIEICRRAKQALTEELLSYGN